jgi:hypothetical protein
MRRDANEIRVCRKSRMERRCDRDMSDKHATCHLRIDVGCKTYPNRRTPKPESGACPLAEIRDAARHDRPWISQSEVDPSKLVIVAPHLDVAFANARRPIPKLPIDGADPTFPTRSVVDCSGGMSKSPRSQTWRSKSDATATIGPRPALMDTDSD